MSGFVRSVYVDSVTRSAIIL